VSAGENRLEIRILQRAPYHPGVEIVIEKLQVRLRYAAWDGKFFPANSNQ